MLTFNIYQIWGRLSDIVTFGAFFSYIIVAILVGSAIYKYYFKGETLRTKAVNTFQKLFYFCVLPFNMAYLCMPHLLREAESQAQFSFTFYTFWRRLDTLLSINLVVSGLILVLILGFGAHRYYIKKAQIKDEARAFFIKFCFFYFLPLTLLVLFFPQATK